MRAAYTKRCLYNSIAQQTNLHKMFEMEKKTLKLSNFAGQSINDRMSRSPYCVHEGDKYNILIDVWIASIVLEYVTM